MANGEALDVTLEVVAVFERLGITYLVGGSIASSLYGIPRATQDVDLVADLSLSDVGPLAEAFHGSYYVEEEMIRRAVMSRKSFNIIHLRTMFKVDVFAFDPETVTPEEMNRRQCFVLPGVEGRSLMLASAEDVILQELHWYVLGNRISDRQWQDVLGVLKVKGTELDHEYLQRIAEENDLASELKEAIEQILGSLPRVELMRALRI